MVVYFDVPDIPGKYFECARYGTMSVPSCVKNFNAAPLACKSGRLEGCIGCAAGAGHAGVNPSAAGAPPPPQSPLTYRTACLRCRRSGRDSSSRLLGRMRLVRDHTICVSCYNREREVLHGANAKGAKPKKWSGLFMSDSVYLKNGRAVRDKFTVPVLDRIEAVLTILRVKESKGVMWTSPKIQRLSAVGV
jgi:hypothetical protein